MFVTKSWLTFGLDSYHDQEASIPTMTKKLDGETRLKAGWDDVRNAEPDSAPQFWPVAAAEVSRHMRQTANNGRVHRLCNSAGGRPIWLYTHGNGKSLSRTANYSAAMGSDDRRSYLGKQRRGYKQTLFILCGIHGMETEGVAGAVNLIHILETGTQIP